MNSERRDHQVHIIEDEEDIANLLKFNLTLAGYQVGTSSTGENGLESIRRQPPDLVLLDLMLPTLDGLSICRRLKSLPKTQDIPIIMISAKGEEEDIVRGLEAGATDYITKPFSPRILLARVKASLRYVTKKEPQAHLKVGEIQIDCHRYRVSINDKEVPLTTSEFRILHLLAQQSGWVLTRKQIVDTIRGKNFAVTERSIDFQMVGLRKKLGPQGEQIKTVRGVGYRLEEERFVDKGRAYEH